MITKNQTESAEFVLITKIFLTESNSSNGIPYPAKIKRKNVKIKVFE